VLDDEVNYCDSLFQTPWNGAETENTPKTIVSKDIKTQMLAFEWAGTEGNATYNMFENVSVMDFHPTELARQLAIIDHRLISMVPLSELNNGAYLKEEDSPFLTIVSKRFNVMVQWIGTLITTNPSIKDRRRLISYFIVVAVKLLSLNNIQGLMSIFVGLTQYTVSRMEHTWSGIAPDLKEKWAKIQTLCSPISNFKHVREKLATCDLPCVKTPAVFVKDMTFLEEGNERYVNKEKTHFNLFRIVQSGLHYENLRVTQKTPYELKTISFIQFYLLNCKYLTVKEQEIQSMRNDAMV